MDSRGSAESVYHFSRQPTRSTCPPVPTDEESNLLDTSTTQMSVMLECETEHLHHTWNAEAGASAYNSRNQARRPETHLAQAAKVRPTASQPTSEPMTSFGEFGDQVEEKEVEFEIETECEGDPELKKKIDELTEERDTWA